MKVSISRNVGIALLLLVMLLSVTYDAMGQGRGRRMSQSDKKCAKFVNCHDARDGRWDGRGPRRNLSLRDRIWRRHRRDRDRDRDFDRITRRRRNRDFDRDWRPREVFLTPSERIRIMTLPGTCGCGGTGRRAGLRSL